MVNFAVAFAKWGDASGEGAATVIATVGSPEQAEIACVAGADHALDYRAGDMATRIGVTTGGAGVDRIVEVAFGRNLNWIPR